jgi:hypothetical protein
MLSSSLSLSETTLFIFIFQADNRYIFYWGLSIILYSVGTLRSSLFSFFYMIVSTIEMNNICVIFCLLFYC